MDSQPVARPAAVRAAEASEDAARAAACPGGRPPIGPSGPAVQNMLRSCTAWNEFVYLSIISFKRSAFSLLWISSFIWIQRKNFFAHHLINIMSAIVADDRRYLAHLQIEHRGMRRRQSGAPYLGQVDRRIVHLCASRFESFLLQLREIFSGCRFRSQGCRPACSFPARPVPAWPCRRLPSLFAVLRSASPFFLVFLLLCSACLKRGMNNRSRENCS